MKKTKNRKKEEEEEKAKTRNGDESQPKCREKSKLGTHDLMIGYAMLCLMISG